MTRQSVKSETAKGIQKSILWKKEDSINTESLSGSLSGGSITRCRFDLSSPISPKDRVIRRSVKSSEHARVIPKVIVWKEDDDRDNGCESSMTGSRLEDTMARCTRTKSETGKAMPKRIHEDSTNIGRISGSLSEHLMEGNAFGVTSSRHRRTRHSIKSEPAKSTPKSPRLKKEDADDDARGLTVKGSRYSSPFPKERMARRSVKSEPAKSIRKRMAWKNKEDDDGTIGSLSVKSMNVSSSMQNNEVSRGEAIIRTRGSHNATKRDVANKVKPNNDFAEDYPPDEQHVGLDGLRSKGKSIKEFKDLEEENMHLRGKVLRIEQKIKMERALSSTSSAGQISSDMQQLDDAMKMLRDSNDRLLSQVKDMEAQHQANQELFERLTKEITEVRIEKQESQATALKLSSDLEKANKEVKNLQAELNERGQSRHEEVSNGSPAREQAKMFEAAMKKAMQHVKMLQSQNHMQEEELRKLRIKQDVEDIANANERRLQRLKNRSLIS